MKYILDMIKIIKSRGKLIFMTDLANSQNKSDIRYESLGKSIRPNKIMSVKNNKGVKI